uniref:SEFIR domain-containing protein n=1 Tax=Macrostomum lignano TaxID=282301 RepID=A0A1I8IVD9_9PLAT
TQHGLGTVSRHAEMCSEMPASLYNYSVQTAQSADSLQSTEFSDTASGLIIGSFELEHCLTPSDSLLIVLGEASDSMGASEHRCRRLTICNQMADGKRRRLRLQLSLHPTRSYTMKVFKLASGSRLSAGDDRPLVQLAARRCGACGDDGSDFRCNMTAYLRSGWVGGLLLKLTGVLGDQSDWIKFPANQSQRVSPSEPLAVCPRPLLPPTVGQWSAPSPSQSARGSVNRSTISDTAPAVLSWALPPALVLALFLALYRALYAQRNCGACGDSNTRKLVLLVLPEAGNPTTRQLIRRLPAAPAGVEIRQVVGLSKLNRQLIGSSCLVIFLSWDSKFDSFQAGSLSDAARRSLRTALLTEKHRMLGAFINSGAGPPADSIWSGLDARMLRLDDEAAWRDLLLELFEQKTEKNRAKTHISHTQHGLGTVSRHAEMCSEMPASLYNYSVQTAQSADSLQSTEFSDTASGLIIGSFELEHCLTPSDSLLIVLGEASDSMGASEHRCRRLTICNQMADGKRRRLRLQLSLHPTRSYTMKVFKLASGSRLCEQPRVRFFFTRSAGDDRPLVQLAARRCGACGDDGSDFRCNMTAYLRSGWVGGLLLKLTGVLGDQSDWIKFPANQSQRVSNSNSWIKANLSMQIRSWQLTYHFRKTAGSRRTISSARRSIFSLGFNDKSLRSPTLCQPSEPLAVCPRPLLPPTVGQWSAPSPSQSARGSVNRSTISDTAPAVLSWALPPALVLALFLALYRALYAQRNCGACGDSNTRKLVLLVLPEAGNPTTRQLIRRLPAAPAGVEIRQVVGLSKLNRQLIGSSCLVIFLSWDSKFDSFQAGSLSDAARRSLRTALLTEKHRMLGAFINSGAGPPADSICYHYKISY